ncbi:MAG: FtsK/SpoIIIE domain-containing protein [Anaerovoracaceae bacterium]
MLFSMYSNIYSKLKTIQDNVKTKQTELEKIRSEFNELREQIVLENEKRISELKEQQTKTQAFVDIARTHTTKTVPSDSAIEFNNRKLSQLAVQINSSNKNDPFATKLYTEATGQLLYLNSELDLQLRVGESELKNSEESYANSTAQIEKEILVLNEEYKTLILSPTFEEFIRVIKAYDEYYCNFNDESLFETNELKEIAIGTIEMPFPMGTYDGNLIIDGWNKYYDKGNIKLPLAIPFSKGQSIIIQYDNDNERNLLKGMQQFILNYTRTYSDNKPHFSFIDTVRFNSSALGELSIFCGEDSSLISEVPLSMDEIRKKVKALITELNNMDSMSVKKNEVVIFHNFPHGYDTALVSQIQQLCVNANHYGITVILTNNVSAKNMVSADTMEYLKSFSLCIDNNRYHYDALGLNMPFSWYEFNKTIPNILLKQYVYEKPVVDKSNEYEKRVGLPTKINYKKGFRHLESIPFGINKDGYIQTLDFENSNFATFICGASRSGKSTLLHTLISGVIKNTHPDDVEIWLIDFKMTEFSRYINHLPPHIRYIILDESPELVYDIINRLTEILQKRQNIFKGKWLKLDDVPPEKYMPSILVIIDEFSVMAQIIADSIVNSKDNYSIKLQTLLAKGAALGLHFVFASQGFTSGTRGLNDFSKKQIQQRIAMKTEFNEIRETLDLKAASDDDKAMMEQLPVHHTLTRKAIDKKGNHLDLSEVLYIKDYGCQEQMIDAINNTVHPEPKYDLNNASAYINKRTLIIDGNKYTSFNEKVGDIHSVLDSRMELLQDGETAYLFVGEPRRMLQVYPIEIDNAFCENLILIAPNSEKMPATSIVLSIEESLALQNKNFEIWTTKKNLIYRQLVGTCGKTSNPIYKDLEEVCSNIKKIKSAIEKKQEADKFIVILGLESMIMDMAFYESSMPTSQKLSPKEQSLISVSIEKRKPGEMDLLTQLSYVESGSFDFNDVQEDEPKEIEDLNQNEADIEEIIYDARSDLKYIFTHGPNLGYHFITVFNSVGEIKQSKIDLSCFKHKLLFRVAKTDAIEIVGSSGAGVVSELDDHIIRYTNGIDSISFRPFLHKGLEWDGWKIGNDGELDLFEDEEYLL